MTLFLWIAVPLGLIGIVGLSVTLYHVYYEIKSMRRKKREP